MFLFFIPVKLIKVICEIAFERKIIHLQNPSLGEGSPCLTVTKLLIQLLASHE